MPVRTRSIVIRAFGLGVAVGLRSQMANAALAWHQPEAPLTARWRRWPVFRWVWGRRLLVLAGAGELIGDKLPMTPSRLEPRAMAGRLTFGAVAGVAIGSEGTGRASLIRGAVAGLFGSAVGAYGGYHVRNAVGKATGLPDPVVAVGEDVAAVTLARAAVRDQYR